MQGLSPCWFRQSKKWTPPSAGPSRNEIAAPNPDRARYQCSCPLSTQGRSAQAKRARSLIRNRATADEPDFITTVVMAQLFWLLERSYKIERESICRLLDALLTKAEFEFEHSDAVPHPFQVYSNGRRGSTNSLLGRARRLLGSQTSYTVDQKAAKLEDFTAA